MKLKKLNFWVWRRILDIYRQRLLKIILPKKNYSLTVLMQRFSHLLKITKISFYHSESISDSGGERTWDCVKKPFQVIIVI